MSSPLFKKTEQNGKYQDWKDSQNSTGSIIGLIKKPIFNLNILVLSGGALALLAWGIHRIGTYEAYDGKLIKPQSGSIEHARTFQNVQWLNGVEEPKVLQGKEGFERMEAELALLKPFLSSTNEQQLGIFQLLVGQEALRIKAATANMMENPNHPCSSKAYHECLAQHLENVDRHIQNALKASSRKEEHSQLFKAVVKIQALHLLGRDLIGIKEIEKRLQKVREQGLPLATIFSSKERLEQTLQSKPGSIGVEKKARQSIEEQFNEKGANK